MTSDVTTRPVFGPHDDSFHFDVLGDDWWATETSWFSFHHPARNLGGWLYTMVRPNIGTVAGGVWVWDHTAHLPWDVLYSTNYTALQLPADVDLTDVALPTGVSIRAVKPAQRYHLGYDDPGRLTLDLTFDAVMPPEPMTSVRSTFGKARHFDQFGRVTGTVVVQGEQIDIDCFAVRDRTWGRRREDRPRKAAYVTGAAGPDDSFLAVTQEDDGVDVVAYGFLRKDGRTVPLVGGERRVERDPVQGWTSRIELEVVDAEGRTMRAVGHPVSRIVINRHTFIDINSLVRWDLDDPTAGGPAWGEDQDMWPVHDWADDHRTRMAGSS